MSAAGSPAAVVNDEKGQLVAQVAERFDPPRVDKFGARRDELADAALLTLGELGYARTSLREIAQNSAFSHGVFHYYFRDKFHLITFCVRRYKEHCVTRYDGLVERARTPEELRDGFADLLVETMCDDVAMHRLWYDLRVQAMFEETLRSTVLDLDQQLEAMIWRVVSRHAELRGIEPAVTPAFAYSVFDGLFENALCAHVMGDGDATARLHGGAVDLLDRLGC